MFLAEVDCDGSEETLLECIEDTAPIRVHPCDHIHDVGVYCQGKLVCALKPHDFKNTFTISKNILFA